MSVVINLDRLLVPRLTTTERDAITAVNGMYIYNVTTNEFQGFESGAWTDAVGGGVTADQAFDSIILDIANMDVTLNRAGAGIAQFTVALDVASQELLRLQSTRATPANLDIISQSFYQPNSASAQFEYGRIENVISFITAGSEGGRLGFLLPVRLNSGTLTEIFRADGAGSIPGFIFNPTDSTFIDFHVRGGAEGFLINADTGLDTVGIGGQAIANVQLLVEHDTNQVSSELLRLQSTRSVRADNDEIFLSFFQPNSIGVQVETHRFISRLTDVTSGTEDTILRIQGNRNGSLADLLQVGRLAVGTPRFGILGSEASIQTITLNFATADATHASRTAAALTDNTTGAAPDGTIADLTAFAASVAWDGAAVFPSAADETAIALIVTQTRDAIGELADQINKLRVDQVDTAAFINFVTTALVNHGIFIDGGG